jgi:hypothetical protein
MRGEIQRRLDEQARGSMCAFAVVEPDSGRAVGMTTYMNIDAANRRLEIGSTWYRRSVQRTASTPRRSGCCWRTRSRISAPSPWSSARISSTTPAATPSTARRASRRRAAQPSDQ